MASWFYYPPIYTLINHKLGFFHTFLIVLRPKEAADSSCCRPMFNIHSEHSLSTYAVCLFKRISGGRVFKLLQLPGHMAPQYQPIRPGSLPGGSKTIATGLW